RMSRRIHAYAKSNNIPVVKCNAGERKHEIAEHYLPTDPNFVGVFLIIIGRAPASVYDIQRSKHHGKIINIVKKKPMPYVNHYSFHIMDPQWGHITIKICGHPPFHAQIILNGHEYVERKAKKAGIEFTKDGNCFTNITNAHHLGLIADTLSHGAIGRLTEVCERWVYSSCLCFALDLDEQQRSGFLYRFFVFQAEYSRNLLFSRGGEMEQIFNGIINHTWAHLDIKRLKTIFGNKKRPSRKRNKKPRLEFVIERPTYDLTIFKLHFDAFTVKFYTKGERVLRAEATLHNAKALRCRRSIDHIGEVIIYLKKILNRFMEAVNCIDISSIDDGRFDALPNPSSIGKTRVGGIDINKPRTRLVAEAIISLSPKPQGFTAAELACAVRTLDPNGHGNYTPRKASYDLKKFRSKNLIHKIENSRKYEPIPEGLRAMVALLVLRDKVVKPILAGAVKIKPGRKPKNQHPLNKHYQSIQLEMKNLFNSLGIAA
ncbi:MAG: hypothetical protein IBX56_15845, partial [Methylomicrobium sp.]|nr:hypothetical protein [Methylomicrobium sp.]